MRSVRRFWGLVIALALVVSAALPARAAEEEISIAEESAAMGAAYYTEASSDPDDPEIIAPDEELEEQTAPTETAAAETEPVETEPEETEAGSDPFDWTEVYTHEFPLYSQLDYPNQRYGNGTVATSGCGITSLAMVAP